MEVGLGHVFSNNQIEKAGSIIYSITVLHINDKQIQEGRARLDLPPQTWLKVW